MTTNYEKLKQLDIDEVCEMIYKIVNGFIPLREEFKLLLKQWLESEG